MFSEYASRFLQQSNTRLSFTQQDQHDQRNPSRNPLDRRRLASNSRYVQRPGMQPPYRNPSTASQSRFPFASRLSRQDPQAPLFYSAADDFQGEDEGDEHEREVADFYALQRSRQQFGPSNLTESSEMEDETMEKVDDYTATQGYGRDESVQRGRTRASRMFQDRDQSPDVPISEVSAPSCKGKGRLVDVNLASTINEEPSESLTNLAPMVKPRERSPPFQNFRPSKSTVQSSFLPMETDEESRRAYPGPPSPGAESVPPTVILPSPQPPLHDRFWANLYQITFFAMLAAFVLIWFHTTTPNKKNPLGDTIYNTIRGSTYMLMWDTVVAIIVSMIWLALLRNHVRTLVFLMLVAVPVVLFTFSLYPFINSFKGAYHGNSLQDRMMRWVSLIPAIVGIAWTYSVIKSRHSLHKSTSILEFSTRIIAASPQLLALGFATLGIVVIFTWVWMLMFERIFLSGHFSSGNTKSFILDANSWWLGAFFILQYLWTLGVISGVQRATTAAVVSQWYFHRLAIPQPTSHAVVKASLSHATGALFGTICLSTFLSLLVRLPLILLPGRLSGLLNMAFYYLIPTSLVTLTNPLTLTYAAIHSQPLAIAARGLSQLSFISRTNPSNTLQPSNLRRNPLNNLNPDQNANNALIPYRLAKLLLSATKTLVSLSLGLVSWVRASHSTHFGSSIKGSLYAYVIALLAGTIGFAVLGAVEGVVSGVLDAAVVCWGSETGGLGGVRGEARFCREAGELFGEEDTGTGGRGGDDEERGIGAVGGMFGAGFGDRFGGGGTRAGGEEGVGFLGNGGKRRGSSAGRGRE
ncbi:hypothetical protein MBLNU230_g7344t1 [Neophaeotheca triangularis]